MGSPGGRWPPKFQPGAQVRKGGTAEEAELRPYRVLIVGALAAAVCVRLGFWQLSRMHQRQALRAMVQGRQRQPVFEVTGFAAFRATTLGVVDSAAYRPAIARGVFDFTRQIVVVARAVDQVPAVYVVTPLRLAGGQAILVQRGWVPSPDASTVSLDSLHEPDSAVVTGTLLSVRAARELAVRDTTWPVRVPVDDPAQLADRYPYPLLPWVLRRSEAPGGPVAGLRAIPSPVIDAGPHLSYAVQWFAFAIIAAAGSVALFLRERGRGKGEGRLRGRRRRWRY